MKTISMLELRTRGKEIVKRLNRGERMSLSYRGKKVATLVPEEDAWEKPAAADDPIRRLCKLAEPGLGSMTSEEIDQHLYGDSKDLH